MEVVGESNRCLEGKVFQGGIGLEGYQELERSDLAVDDGQVDRRVAIECPEVQVDMVLV